MFPSKWSINPPGSYDGAYPPNPDFSRPWLQYYSDDYSGYRNLYMVMDGTPNLEYVRKTSPQPYHTSAEASKFTKYDFIQIGAVPARASHNLYESDGVNTVTPEGTTYNYSIRGGLADPNAQLRYGVWVLKGEEFIAGKGPPPDARSTVILFPGTDTISINDPEHFPNPPAGAFPRWVMGKWLKGGTEVLRFNNLNTNDDQSGFSYKRTANTDALDIVKFTDGNLQYPVTFWEYDVTTGLWTQLDTVTGQSGSEIVKNSGYKTDKGIVPAVDPNAPPTDSGGGSGGAPPTGNATPLTVYTNRRFALGGVIYYALLTDQKGFEGKTLVLGGKSYTIISIQGIVAPTGGTLPINTKRRYAKGGKIYSFLATDSPVFDGKSLTINNKEYSLTGRELVW